MDYFSIEKNNINVVYDSSLIDEAYGITPEIRQILQELYPKVQRGKQSTIKKLKKYCRRYPHIPHFKNYLEAAYQQAGKTQKAVEMNRITVEEHPDYLFGKINYANILLEEGEVGKVPDVLGKELDLKALYPSRDAFHLREILGFYQVCVRYYLAVDNQDKAEDCMALMNEVGPDEPETEEASFRWTSAMMEGAARRIEEENKRRRSVESSSYDDSVQTTEKPVFNHSEIEALYANGVRIDHGIVRKILQLPIESLIEDLETVVEDSIRRFEYFRELDGQNEEWQTEKFSFNMHALFLLAELEAEESLPQVLRLLRQGQEFLDFWFADMLDQIGREVIFKVGQHKLSELQAFVKEPDNYCFARNTIPAALTQLALHKKDRRAEVVEWFDELFHFFLENTGDDRIIDTDLISFMVWDCIDLGAAELEERIQDLYDHTLVEPGIAGTVEDALRDMKSAQYSSRKYKIDDIFSRYDYLADLWYPDANQSIFDTYLQNNKGTQLFSQQEPFVSEKEVGRNDPCPCGSGKKYKYCCMR